MAVNRVPARQGGKKVPGRQGRFKLAASHRASSAGDRRGSGSGLIMLPDALGAEFASSKITASVTMSGNASLGASSLKAGRLPKLGAASRPPATSSRSRGTPVRAETAPRNSGGSPLPAPAGAAPSAPDALQAYPAAAKPRDALSSILPFRTGSKPVSDTGSVSRQQEREAVRPPPSWPSAAARRGLYSDVAVERVRLGGHSIVTQPLMVSACEPCTAPSCLPRSGPPERTHTNSQVDALHTRVQGRLPTWLRGSFYRNGPGGLARLASPLTPAIPAVRTPRISPTCCP